MRIAPLRKMLRSLEKRSVLTYKKDLKSFLDRRPYSTVKQIREYWGMK